MGCSYSNREAYKAAREKVRAEIIRSGPLPADRIEALAQSFLSVNYPGVTFGMGDFVGACLYWQEKVSGSGGGGHEPNGDSHPSGGVFEADLLVGEARSEHPQKIWGAIQENARFRGF